MLAACKTLGMPSKARDKAARRTGEPVAGAILRAIYLLCNGAAACYRPWDQLNNWLMADDGAPRAAKRARSAPAAGEGSSMVARQAAENAAHTEGLL